MALLVDLDMTLVKNLRELVSAMVSVQAEYGFAEDPDPPDLLGFLKNYYRGAVAPRLGRLERWIFWRRVWLRYHYTGSYGEPSPCSSWLLESLSGRIPTAIVTGREMESRLIAEELSSQGLPIHRVEILSAGDLGLGASKKDLYEALAQRLSRAGIDRRRIVVLSDSPRDLEDARGVGMGIVGCAVAEDPEIFGAYRRLGAGFAASLCDLLRAWEGANIPARG